MMHDVALEQRDPAQLLEEIARLRSEVARLESRVEELDRLAHRDPLVPLFNRRGMLRELETMIARHDRHGNPAAVLFVDLNDLKLLNDSFGHMGGDAALVTVAEKLVEGTRATDCVARLGGDEFCILLDHADEKSAIETAERLVDIIAHEECLFEGAPMPLSVAIGVTLIEKGDTPATVLARADKAMYRVKAAA
ncbi:GGDEF domain-containing protein [Sphingomonas sp. RB56-2]|uniref:diguanylate cyclase n=1 Tax=Sphingomonas brevis TaxID=2908206 RepID=A0ABT0SBC8_9SPHN|nr:GGDEF domain-containing protein [Sphingomonas brevis]MCL6741724.1 GGDEF domain-containing protein [Sphingomonas brevis]